MCRILVIDSDVETLLGYKAVLRSAGHDVTTAALGEDGLVTACRDQFDVVLCDLRLRDVSGIEVVRQIRRSSPRTTIVLATAWATREAVIQAKRAGATTYVEKPIIGDALLAAIEDGQRLGPSPEIGEPTRVGYAAQRWAGVVVRAAYFADDPRTVAALCGAVGMARGTLKGWCRAVGVTPKRSLDFVRLLHVVLHHSGEPWNLQSFLDVTDHRTMQALTRRAGFTSLPPKVPEIKAFLTNQRLITVPELVEAPRRRLLTSQIR